MVAAMVLALTSAAQERIDTETDWRIRREATEHSQIMRTLHVLTDRYGPRLTGSPNHEAAAKWVAAQLNEWGLQNVKLEPWKFGHSGWLNERASGFLIAPANDTLTFEVLGWTPSTNGPVTASAIELTPPRNPTKQELATWLDANKDKVRGRIVLIGKATVVPVAFNSPAKRIDDADLIARFDPVNPQTPNFGRRADPTPESKLSARRVDEILDPWLVANGALVRVNDGAREHGQIRAFANRSYDVAKAVPTVVLRNEDYGRIERLLADGDVQLQFDIVNHVYPDGVTSYNVSGEIPGSDKTAEIVMLGGHLDSWHGATGATDNAIGSTMMLEAVRLIRALGLKPRRTIRIALWSGEEQGLLGSQAYVKQHFGTFEDPKPEFSKLAAYFNIDSGTGRVRGAGVFGPPSAATVIREALAPFEDLGVVGAAASKSRNLGGTDSTSFNAAGLAGIGLNQDPIEYGMATWHTNLDTYERVVPDDAVKSSIVIAAAVWHVANRDAMLPRFTTDHMPPPAKGTDLKLDHVTIAGLDLATMRKQFEHAGIPTEFGGKHTNGMTEMALASFPDGSYLELIAAQPGANVAKHEWARFIEKQGGPCAWAITVPDIKAELDRLERVVIEATPQPGGRERPDGKALRWTTAAIGPAPQGSLFPFLIEDDTLRTLRANPSGKPTTTAYTGVERVVIAVRDLDAAIAQWRKTFGLPAPKQQDDASLGAHLAWFEGTPVILASAASNDSVIAHRINGFGEAPFAFLLGAKTISDSNVTWFDQRVKWFDTAALNGAHIGIIAK